jgi:hypothetical protein
LPCAALRSLISSSSWMGDGISIASGMILYTAIAVA